MDLSFPPKTGGNTLFIGGLCRLLGYFFRLHFANPLLHCGSFQVKRKGFTLDFLENILKCSLSGFG
ncbi:MAG: hypothetical protein LBI05_02970 [Planctomycetaceae bacterium]|jgi:hypothetical protein|nr:hypothetical protein [Planctomycetaceae bacterium]